MRWSSVVCSDANRLLIPQSCIHLLDYEICGPCITVIALVGSVIVIEHMHGKHGSHGIAATAMINVR